MGFLASDKCIMLLQQKIVIKVQLHCRRCRSKAMKMAAMASGVNSVALAGEEKDQIVVVGEKVDAAGLTDLLRKKVGYATLELVEGVSVKA
ncbi:hypothetical protein RJ640_004818 [Escallonia rubra]|uniref:HMA domain-containing protein n=1 Tax=Escallonia rubra TaxID=112253 RepID=A0AA88UTD6_9ASTE|nr:hypothetical protein RJ640_004818 [Escallonia rubra]